MIEAAELREANAVRYLTGIPLLGDYLEDGQRATTRFSRGSLLARNRMPSLSQTCAVRGPPCPAASGMAWRASRSAWRLRFRTTLRILRPIPTLTLALKRRTFDLQRLAHGGPD